MNYKRILNLALACILAISMFSTSVLATDAENLEDGTQAQTEEKQTPDVTPNYLTIRTSDKRISEARLQVGSSSVPGKIDWKVPPTTIVRSNVAYEWVFTPTETDKYEIVTGEIVLYNSSAGGSTTGDSGIDYDNPYEEEEPVVVSPGAAIVQGDRIHSEFVVLTRTASGMSTDELKIDEINLLIDELLAEVRRSEKPPKMTFILETNRSTNGISLTIPKSGLEKILTGDDMIMEINSEVGNMSFDEKALEEILKNSDGKITFTLDNLQKDELTEEQSDAFDERPAVDVSISSGDLNLGNLGDGEATIAIPYELGKNELSQGVKAYNLSENYEKTSIETDYNAVNKEVTIKTNDVSLFLIDYEMVSNPFKDNISGEWYFDSVSNVYEKGIMSGISNSEFGIKQYATRAMIWTILARLDGVDTDNGATWYEASQKWVIEEGISDGSNPNGYITREDLVTMLYRYEQNNGGGFEGTYAFYLDFSDRGDISAHANEAMMYMIMKNVISGKDDGKLYPKGLATRAEIATIISRYLEI